MSKAVRFCQNNRAAVSGVVVTPSTEKSGFPVENALSAYRTLRWITTGCFRVVSTNKKIYINDGSNKTITLTETTYATGALMAAHIQTQLNASSSNWTCTYSTTTYKFTIGRSSGTAILRFTVTTDASWDMLGYTLFVDTATSTGLAASEVRIHTSERVRFDLLASLSCPAFFVIGACDEDFTLSSAATQTIKGDDIEALLDSTPAIDQDLTREATGTFQFLDDLDAYSLRYWQWEFIDRQNPNGPEFEIHNIYLGDYVTPVNRNLSNGFTRKLVDPSIVTRAVSGASFYGTKKKYWTFSSMTMEEMTGSDRTEVERVFNEMGITTPFFVSLDPSVVITESLGEATKLVTFDDFDCAHVKFNKYALQMSLREVCD